MKNLFPSIGLLFLIAVPAHAASPGDVVITEVAWMGSPPQGGGTTRQAANDEWIELYNTTSGAMALGGWILASTDGGPSIELSGNIPAGGYFLLSRANELVGGISADLVYSYTGNALNNDGEHLELKDAQGNPIDGLNAFGGWFAGDNSTKQTMERKNLNPAGSDPAGWATSADPGGTPKALNSTMTMTNDNDPTTSPLPSAEPIPPAEPDPVYEPAASSTLQSATSSAPVPREVPRQFSAGIFINELLPSPLGPDELEEWIELINESAEPADVSGWQIKDTIGATNIYTFPEGASVPASGFLVLSRPTTKITMNNDNDAVQLIRPDAELVQTVPYESAPKGKSFVRSEGAWKWSAIPTPGSANIVPKEQEESAGTIENVKKVVSKYDDARPLVDADNKKIGADAVSATDQRSNQRDIGGSQQTASIGQQSSPAQSSLPIALLASSIALLSALFVFILKKRLQKT